ncbi:hypothetical protein CC1G_07582 [Coprinopsis cinerea okayama7|uniref:Uncharacterized protein n=1 Tax=Coprinopsis cinerea (strain Okayama-7 / 130 / ATCC MYA-4618 / FGSC 9003) TaxID=240176 RepID=A8NUP1_COPC7|nr:hypothetical protein CC1G_07582 [Coprinopsis cinerea okayama7\|eukprot:XP_001836499.2 hypothetical protein CC1G_07582 [Coprinopsis cinerea okayama7\
MVAKLLTLFATLSAVLAVTVAAPQAVPSPAPSDEGTPIVDPALSPVPTDAGDAGAAAISSSPIELIPAPTPTESVDVSSAEEPAPADTPVGVDEPVDESSESPVQAQVDIPTTEILPSATTFDGWGGLESLKGFDNFYGKYNFDGHKYKQIIVKPKKELVCRVRKVEVIQQRLLVLQELAKKVITEKVCDVETQAIVFSQWYGGLRGFERDLLRLPGHHQVGYDEKIVDHYNKFFDHKGDLTDDVWDFTGHDLGKNVVIVKGHNWDDKRSFKTVRNAWHRARNAWSRFW